jgi:hypothetical protein
MVELRLFSRPHDGSPTLLARNLILFPLILSRPSFRITASPLHYALYVEFLWIWKRTNMSINSQYQHESESALPKRREGGMYARALACLVKKSTRTRVVMDSLLLSLVRGILRTPGNSLSFAALIQL